MRRPDGGTVTVLGLDPERDGNELRPRIGAQLQTSALPERMRVWEALDLFASFYQRAVDWNALLERLGLMEKRSAFFSKLSGGQKQRLFIGLALINDPEVVFLDELTTGLDPQARRAIWDLVRDVRESGKTVVLTTHFMEEAERLCDRVAILEHGRIVALNTPAELIQSIGAETRIAFTVDGRPDLSWLKELATVTGVDVTDDRYVVRGASDRVVVEVVNALSAKGVRFRGLRTEQPTLEDVFLKLTGRQMRD
jgi:ABC-2 type transport system ATP-binding protein